MTTTRKTKEDITLGYKTEACICDEEATPVICCGCGRGMVKLVREIKEVSQFDVIGGTWISCKIPENPFVTEMAICPFCNEDWYDIEYSSFDDVSTVFMDVQIDPNKVKLSGKGDPREA